MVALRVVLLGALGVAFAVGCTDHADVSEPSNVAPAPDPEPSDEAVLAAEPIVDETIEIDPEEPDYRSDEGL